MIDSFWFVVREDGLRRRPGLRGLQIWLSLLIPVLVAAAATLGIVAKPAGLVGKLGAHFAVIDMSGGQYRASPVLAKGRGGEDFDAMMARLRPYAAITGTFYDENLRPQGDVVADGRVLICGHHRQAVGFTRSGRIAFVERRPNHRIDWSGYVSGLAAGPRLLRKGSIDIDVRRDGFGAAAATIKAQRCAVGASADGRLIMCVVTRPITLATMAAVMMELGARDAVNMDGGGSCALYMAGESLVKPQRPMSNVLAVYKR